MKRLFLFVVLAAMTLCCLYAQEDDRYTLDNIRTGIKSAGEPYIKDKYIVFTAEDNHRFTGIAFDFEDYRTIHAFEKLVSYDYDNNPQGTVLFYIIPVPKNSTGISYRMIFDGLWTTDPLNPVKQFSFESGTYVSKFSYANITPTVTEKKNDKVTFIHNSDPGRIVRLSGTFTNWDSFIYYMNEISPGHYELELPLPAGTYYYCFYEGLSPILDTTNPAKVYTPEGRIASVITVD